MVENDLSKSMEQDASEALSTENLQSILQKSKKNPVWEGVKHTTKRAREWLPQGFLTGGLVGILVAGACFGFSFVPNSVPFLGSVIGEACRHSIHALGGWSFLVESTLLHGIGHAFFDGFLEGKSAHREANAHNKSIAQIEKELAEIEQTLEQRLPDMTPDKTRQKTYPIEVASPEMRMLMEMEMAEKGTWQNRVGAPASQAQLAGWQERVAGPRQQALEAWQERLLKQQTVVGPASQSIH